MTDPLIPEIVHLKGGMKAVYISHELLALTRRGAEAKPNESTTERKPA
jgi:alpha-D-ribose 1-methylphosphonate 5-triphosphate synthase subunit PhnI